jgi:DnaJ-class molecular chaperone
MTKEWMFEGSRECSACEGTGKPPKRDFHAVYQDGGPIVCQTCNGKGVEKRAFTFAELTEYLAGLEGEPTK